MKAREIARSYIARGWAVIPVAFKKKSPVIAGWPELRISASAVDEYFAAENQNIGVLLGAPSGGLVDIDLDSPEAVEFAEGVLVPTATFGRESKRASHWLYKSDVASTYRLTDPTAKERGHNELLLEVRSTGSQTVFPGSTHPSGESITWDNGQDPVEIAPEDLSRRVYHLGAVALLKRYFPARGGRHEAAVVVSALLARARVDDEIIARLVTRLSDGESLTKHLKLAAGASARAEDGRPLPGIPKFLELYGRKVGERILEWLQIREPRSTSSEVLAAADALSQDSGPSEINAVLVLLRQAHLPRLEQEEVFHQIKRRTGKNLSTLRKAYGPARKSGEGNASQAHALVEIGKSAVLFYDEENGEPFALIERDGHKETHKIGGSSFREWLAQTHHKTTGAVAGRAAIDDALNTLSGLAKWEGEKHRTWLRVARQDDMIFVDIGDPTWDAVRITRDGWDIVSNHPVRFRRSSGHPLSRPEPGGSLSDLRPFVNSDDANFVLVVAVLVNAFVPDKPFPILLITGEKGTAKSTLLVLLRQLTDPAPAPGAGLPKNEGDLVIAAKHNWVVSGDNLSRIRADMADALCRLSTGGGLRKRMLYTDGEQFSIEVRRPTILTSLSTVSTREDFLHRAVMVTLDRIEGTRKTEEQITSEFAVVRARILGVLFDGVAAGLRYKSSIQIDDLPRMADFVLFATAAGKAFGWGEEDLRGAYERMQEALFEESAMGDPILQLVADWLWSQQIAYPGFDGSPGELLQHLTDFCETRHSFLPRGGQWPKSASSLSHKLRAGRTGLLQLKVDATVTRTTSNTSRVILNYAGERTPLPENDLPF